MKSIVSKILTAGLILGSIAHADVASNSDQALAESLKITKVLHKNIIKAQGTISFNNNDYDCKVVSKSEVSCYATDSVGSLGYEFTFDVVKNTGAEGFMILSSVKRN